MDIRNPDERAAYLQGARDAMESIAMIGDARGVRMLEGWIKELEDWTDGDPPPPPYRWE